MADDGQHAFLLTAPELEKHYKGVVKFFDVRARNARFLSVGLGAVMGISLLSNVGLSWALASMLPLTKLVPVYFVVRTDGTIDSSPALSSLAHTTDQAVIRSELWQYVQRRESYSYDTAEYNYNIVSGMSGPSERTAYQSWFNYPNPASPQTTIGKNGVVTVQLIAVALIAPNVASIRFQRTVAMTGSDPQVTTWTATESFQQVDAMPEKERLEDPGGVVVTNYQVEQDTTE